MWLNLAADFKAFYSKMYTSTTEVGSPLARLAACLHQVSAWSVVMKDVQTPCCTWS